MVSRRSVLYGLAGTAAFAAAPVGIRAGKALAQETAGPQAASGSQAPAQIPDTLTNGRKGLSNGSQVQSTKFPLTVLSLSAAVPTAVRFKTATGWTDWTEGAGCSRARDDRPGRTQLFFAGGAQGYEVQTKGGGEVRTLEVNTVDGPRRRAREGARRLQLSSTSAGLELLPTYLSRAAWGANESLRFAADGTDNWPTTYRAGRILTVHHSGFDSGLDNTTTDPAALVRGIYAADVDPDKYGDIGYNLLIDGDGKVYEGRYTGDDGIPVFGPDELRRVNKGEDPATDDPTGPAPAPSATAPAASGKLYPAVGEGAHVFRYNPGNIGICMIGNFMDRQPKEAAYKSLVVVLALLAKRLELDPVGKVDYFNPNNGRAQHAEAIISHGDWHGLDAQTTATDCPGAQFHPLLPQLRQDVRSIMNTFRR